MDSSHASRASALPSPFLGSVAIDTVVQAPTDVLPLEVAGRIRAALLGAALGLALIALASIAGLLFTAAIFDGSIS